jgi:hypothetical protein
MMPLTAAEQMELKALEGASAPAARGGLSSSEQAELSALEKATPAPGAAARIGTAGLRGLSGGPLGLVSSVGGEAMKIGGEKLDKAAYQAGGKVTDITGSPELGFATNVGIQAVPAFIGGGMGKQAAPLMEKLSKELMQSALKPSKAELLSGKGGKAVKTLLDEGANVTEGGVEKLRGRIDDLKSQSAQMVQGSRGVVDKNEVVKELQSTFDKAMKQANPQASLDTINKAAQEFLNHPLFKNANQIPVELANQIKQGTYAALGDKAYGMGLKPAAERDALKGLARGLRQEIEKVFPQIKQLNAKESELINAEMMAKARVLMDSNKNPMGLGWLISHPLEAAAWIIDRSPMAKSLLARAGYSGRERLPQAAGATAGAAAGMITGREPTAADMVGIP